MLKILIPYCKNWIGMKTTHNKQKIYRPHNPDITRIMNSRGIFIYGC